MINTGHQNPRRQTEWTRYSNSTTTHRGYTYTYTNTSGKDNNQRKRSAKIVSIGIYFFLASLLTCGILIIME
jgi:hypothetical protein